MWSLREKEVSLSTVRKSFQGPEVDLSFLLLLDPLSNLNYLLFTTLTTMNSNLTPYINNDTLLYHLERFLPLLVQVLSQDQSMPPRYLQHLLPISPLQQPKRINEVELSNQLGITRMFDQLLENLFHLDRISLLPTTARLPLLRQRYLPILLHRQRNRTTLNTENQVTHILLLALTILKMVEQKTRTRLQRLYNLTIITHMVINIININMLNLKLIMNRRKMRMKKENMKKMRKNTMMTKKVKMEMKVMTMKRKKMRRMRKKKMKKR